ncbi:MAG: T9SS type A sorting domain-containing protein [Bacteroidota bacterium]|nr:T9SS type A sorting domain-containing protein [Bacteroidota bacterium]
MSKGYNCGTYRTLRWNTSVNYPVSYPTYTSPYNCSQSIGPVDLEDVAAHELGHGVGLGHVSAAFSMYTLRYTDYNATKWWEKTWRRTLETGDKAGKIYQAPDFTSGGSQANSKILLSNPSIVTIAGNFTVNSGQYFEVEAGKTLKFSAPGTGMITSYGEFKTSGTSTNHVTITSASATPSPGDWYAIYLYGGPNTLKYCEINYATYGIILSSTQGTIIENCNIRNCSQTGVYEMNSMGYGALRLIGTIIKNNQWGLAVVNSWASLESNTQIQNNISGGFYVGNGYVYMGSTLLQLNGSYGIWVDQSGSNVYFSPNGYSAGGNTVKNNTIRQVWSKDNANLFIGYKALVCECDHYSSSIMSLNKPAPGCEPPCSWEWQESGGYNSISGGDDWIWNHANPIYAHLTYWGDPPSCTVPPEKFLGSGIVYRDYPLCSQTTMMASSGELPVENVSDISSNISSSDDSSRIIHLIKYLKRVIIENPDSADYVLPMLLPFIGPGGQFNYALDEPWEIFLEQTEKTTTSKSIKTQAYIYRVLNRMFEQDYNGVIALADGILTKKPSNELWLYAQSQKIYSYLLLGDISNMKKVYEGIKSKGMRIDPQWMAELQRMIDLSSGKIVSVQQFNNIDISLSASAIPSNYSLSQNYPNPFNPVTTIQYTLTEDEKVTLIVYNVLGQVVRTLVDEVQDAGYKFVEFDATGLPSGVYFYQLKAGRYYEVKKMLVAN